MYDNIEQTINSTLRSNTKSMVIFMNWASNRDKELARVFRNICMQRYTLGTPVALATWIAPPSAPKRDNSSDSVAKDQPIGGAKKCKEWHHAWHRKKPKENYMAWSLLDNPNKPYEFYFGNNEKGRQNVALILIWAIQSPHHNRYKTGL